MQPFALLFVFVSTSVLVQGTIQQSSGSQCNCCDQCDQTATVSKLLSDLSDMLVVDDRINTTTVSSTTITEKTTSDPTVNLSTTQTTADPPTTVNPTTVESQSTSSTTETPSATLSPSAIIYSSETRDSPTPSMAVDPLPTTSGAAIKLESSTATNAPSIIDDSLLTLPTTTVSPITTVKVDVSTKLSVCPENCYLDITGVYCNCYQPTEATRTDN